MRFDVRADEDVTHLMLFTLTHAAIVRPPAKADLMWRSSPKPPADVVARLKLPDDTWLEPTLKSLADPDVEGQAPYRALAIDVPGVGTDRVSVWACAVTRDGWLSPLAGPWTL